MTGGTKLVLCLLTAAIITMDSPLNAQPLAKHSVRPRVVPLWADAGAVSQVSSDEPAQTPHLLVYTPFAGRRQSDTTIVIIPGGGFFMLSPYEQLLGEYFRALGYAAVVVNYRITPHRYPAGFVDAARAVRMVRQYASDWGIPTRHLVVLGGSAGGFITALLATRPDVVRDPADDLAETVSARPDGIVLLYPVIDAVSQTRSEAIRSWLANDLELGRRLSPELHVTEATPPAILLHASDDTKIPVENSISYAKACWNAGVSAELHVFPRGGHGRTFGYDPLNTGRWRDVVQTWLEQHFPSIERVGVESK